MLLDAATAPPSVEELAGETAAVTRFVAAFRSAAAEPSANNRVWVRRPARMLAIKVAAGVAVLAAGGTAVAAETGSLPAGVQHFFSALVAPAPDGGPHPTPTDADPAHSGGSASSVPSPTPAPSRSGATASPAETTALGLCRAWDDARTDPRGKPMPAASRRALAAAAGGEGEISGFCVGVLSTSSSQATGSAGAGTASDQGTPGNNSGSNPSSSNGNGSGGGNGGGNGNGAGNGNGGNNNGGGNGNGNDTGKKTVPPDSAPSPSNALQR